MKKPDLSKFFRNQPWKWVLLFAAMQALVSLSTYEGTLSFDESIWYYIGSNWFRRGLIPYHGGVDNKSPLIFVIFGFSDQLFGINEWFPRLLGTAVQSLGLFFVYKLGNLLSGGKAGLAAMTIYGLALLWPASGGKYVAYTETYSVTAIILAFYFFLVSERQDLFILSGIMAGIGVGFRVTAVFAALALLISGLLTKPKSIVPVIFGMVVSMSSLLAAASLCGIHLRDILEYGFLDNFGPGSPTDHDLYWKANNFLHHFIYSSFIVFIPVLIGWMRMPSRNYPLFIWFFLAFLGIHGVGIYSTQHFKEVLPSLALISALVILYFTEHWQIPHNATYLLIWILFFPKTLEPALALRNACLRRQNDPGMHCQDASSKPDEYEKKELGLWIKSATDMHDKVFIAGYGAVVQVYAERTSPSIYFNATQTGMAIGRLRYDLSIAKPALVVIPRFAEYQVQVNQDLRKTVEILVARGYHYERCAYGYNVYRVN